MNSELMKHQYAHTIPTGQDRTLLAITSSCLHVAIQDRATREMGKRVRRAGDECCGRNLHQTACRPLHDHEGLHERSEGTKGTPFPPHPLLVRCARRAGLHFTYFAYETHANVKPRRPSLRWIISPGPTTRLLDVSSNNIRARAHGDCLLSMRPEVVWLAEGMPLLSWFSTMRLSTITARRRNSALAIILTVYTRGP